MLRTITVAIALVFAAAPSFADPKPDAKQLAADRVATAKKVLDMIASEQRVGVGSMTDVPAWSLRLLDAQLDDPATTSKPRALQDHLDRVTAVRDDVAGRVKAMAASARELAQAEYFVAEAKLWVARGKK